MNPVEIVALDALDLLVVVDNESDTREALTIKSFVTSSPCSAASRAMVLRRDTWQQASGLVCRGARGRRSVSTGGVVKEEEGQGPT
jgi:hypothetical protein